VRNPALFSATTQGSKSSSFIQWPFLTAAVVGGSWPCPQMFNHHHSPRFDPGVPGRAPTRTRDSPAPLRSPSASAGPRGVQVHAVAADLSVAAVLIHIPDADQINPPTVAEELNEKISAVTRRKPEIDHFPAGHAFLNEEDLLGTLDAEQAEIAWDRTIAFLRALLG
jgi:dienelactone hydrolase